MNRWWEKLSECSKSCSNKPNKTLDLHSISISVRMKHFLKNFMILIKDGNIIINIHRAANYLWLFWLHLSINLSLRPLLLNKLTKWFSLLWNRLTKDWSKCSNKLFVKTAWELSVVSPELFIPTNANIPSQRKPFKNCLKVVGCCGIIMVRRFIAHTSFTFWSKRDSLVLLPLSMDSIAYSKKTQFKEMESKDFSIAAVMTRKEPENLFLKKSLLEEL